MGKMKKKNLSESVQQKNKKQFHQTNPFEIQINRDKQKVLGRKSKNDRGLPGISRAKAINRRKQSLLQEYILQDKNNVFLDKRIGEKNYAMNTEDKATARFAMERMKAHKRDKIFNLNDEVLTHRGQTLEEIEKFDDPRSDDEFSDNENVSGKLDENFVQEAHFGGGILSKADSTLSRKDLIDQLIAESKKQKAEKQKIRKETIGLTEKLDSEWKDLLPFMSASKKSTENIDDTTKTDAYDVAVRQLKFEARGHPSEKLKSEQQIIQEEKEKLEKLEADRLARMKGFVCDTGNQFKHKSADDLEDGFIMETIEDNDDIDDSIIIDTNINQESNDEDDNDDKQTENKSEYITDKERVKNINTRKDSKNQEKYSESNTKDKSDTDFNDKDSESGNSNDESEDDFSDLKMSESSCEDESETEVVNESKKRVMFSNDSTKDPKQINQSNKINHKSILKQSNSTHVQNSCDKIQQIRNDLSKQKEIMEKARNELSYTYSAPESYEELEKLLSHYNADYQSVIVDRIIKCNHWTLDGRNREKMSSLFVYLLQYINNCASTESADDLIKCFQIFDRLCPYLYDLAHMNSENAKICIQEVIEEKYNKFEKNKTKFPGMDTLIFFKLVSLLFPTSDFRHPIVSPCLIFMSQILIQARIKKYRSDISKGLFICTLILEYTILSKRFAPSVINFLRGIIYITTPAVLTQNMKIIPPFKTTNKVLVVNKAANTIDSNSTHMFASDLIHEKLDDIFRIRSLLTAVNLLIEFKNQLQELESAYSIFEHILQLLKINEFNQYPPYVRDRIKELVTELEFLQNKKLEYIVQEKKRPKPLKTYEPKIMAIYSGKRNKSMSKEKAEREKLLHKYKREFKGAIREIRKDRDFLAKVQIGQQIKSDIIRRQKINKIFGEAANQQSEFKKMKKRK
ncbi:PREDICTED: nucleolar protein 14 homolog [Cyphomyrmex costatus]|uniref:nucleolar protein 14 homolog n=1 Tax=Cyphomyrmex costatus TaxID=456900 RepID=UPI0008523EC4|nr:PREDICTED: nucleolar protein 14 homolog [Cyphomyrmex costatus]